MTSPPFFPEIIRSARPRTIVPSTSVCRNCSSAITDTSAGTGSNSSTRAHRGGAALVERLLHPVAVLGGDGQLAELLDQLGVDRAVVGVEGLQRAPAVLQHVLQVRLGAQLGRLPVEHLQHPVHERPAHRGDALDLGLGPEGRVALQVPAQRAGQPRRQRRGRLLALPLREVLVPVLGQLDDRAVGQRPLQAGLVEVVQLEQPGVGGLGGQPTGSAHCSSDRVVAASSGASARSWVRSRSI